MGKTKINVTDNILEKLPLEQEKPEKILKPGLKKYSTRNKKVKNNIVGETFGALPIKNHDLIEEVYKQVKHGE